MQPQVQWNGPSKDWGIVQFGDDSNLVVTFYNKSVIDQNQSQAQGLPVYKTQVYVKIFRAGELQNVIDRPVEEVDKQRFRNRWEQFNLNQSQIPEGTPVELLFPNHPGVADSLKSRGIFTVQQLSQLTAHAIDQIGMGGQEYVNRAKAYLEAATDNKHIVAMQDTLRRKEQEIETLNRQMTQMQEMIKALNAKLNNPLQLTAAGNMQMGNVSADIQAERINANNSVNRELPIKK